MKRKSLTFICALLFAIPLNAQDVGRVIIRNAGTNYPKFIVSMNGIRLSNEYSSTVSYDYLDENVYKVRILQAGSRGVLSLVLNSSPNYVSRFVINRDNFGNYSVILESKSLMTAEESVPVNTVSSVPAVSAAPVAAVATVQPEPAIKAPQPMNNDEYNEILRSVKKESLERTRLEMAKTFYGNQNLSSDQVAGIMKAFSLENSKLDFARFVYSRTIDRNNYIRVMNSLTLSSSKRDLSEYIKNYSD